MARRHRLVKVGPRKVWAVLADGSRYAEWVVGTASSRPVRGQWPNVGAAIEYELRIGPIRLTNETVVRHCEEPSVLEMEAKAGALGTARISVELRPWGEYSLVIVDEHPLRGAADALHNVGVEALMQLRHRAMLARLAHLCEAEPDRPENAHDAAAGQGVRRKANGQGHA